MDTKEFDVLLDQLETKSDMTVADFSAVVQALHYLLPDDVAAEAQLAGRLNETDDAMLIADHAFPNWSVNIHGRANDHDGHWRCTLREDDSRDSDKAIGIGRSPVLSQAVLAAVMRLAMQLGPAK